MSLPYLCSGCMTSFTNITPQFRRSRSEPLLSIYICILRFNDGYIITIPSTRLTDPGVDYDSSTTAFNQRTVRRSHGDSHAGRSSAFDMDYLIETDLNTSMLNSTVMRTFAENERSSRGVVFMSPADSDMRGLPAQNSRDSLFYSEHSGNRRTLPTRTSDPFRY